MVKFFAVVAIATENKMDMNERITITPWFSQEEWLNVACCIITATDPVSADKYLQDKHRIKDHANKNPAVLYLRAIEEINTWKTRANKLPSGVETSLCLLTGAITYANSTNKTDCSSTETVRLCLATAINRFLNLVCHTGFNLFGLTKYYDVAEKFAIPDWIVDVRHETAHGHMPSEELLLDALAFSLRWIVLNYWVPEYKNYTGQNIYDNLINDETSYLKETPIYKKINSLLDCYRYLKLYTIWGGVQKLSDLKDQDEIYEHVMEHLEILLPISKKSFESDDEKQSLSNEHNLLQNQKSPKSNKKKKKQLNNDTSKTSVRSDLNELRIGNAMNLIQDKINSTICSLNNRQGGSAYNKLDCHKSIIANLLYEELMLPNRDFFNSLMDNDSFDNQSSGTNIWKEENLHENLRSISNNSHFKPLKLPKDLIYLWSEILKMIAINGPEELLSDLLYTLHEVSGSHSADLSDKNIIQRCLASAWICEICESLSCNSSVKSFNKDLKNKKQSKNNKEKIKESKLTSKVLKLSAFQISGKEFQESFCHRVVMNPLTPLTIHHLPVVLSLTLIKEAQKTTCEQSISAETQKKRIFFLFCTLFGIKENVPKISSTLKIKSTGDEIQTVNSVSDYIKSLKRQRDDNESGDYNTQPTKQTKVEKSENANHKVNIKNLGLQAGKNATPYCTI